MVNEPNGQDFTVRFSQKNSDLNKVDLGSTGTDGPSLIMHDRCGVI